MNFQNRTTFIFRQTAARITVLFLLFLFTAVRVFTQTQTRMPPAPQQPTEDYMWWYLLLFALLLALAGAVVWMLKTRKAEKEPATRISKKEKLMSDDNAWDDNSIDANRGLEWFRRHKKSIGKSIGKSGKRNLAESLPKTGQIFNLNDSSDDLSSEEFKEKLENLQVTQFPVFRFEKLELARPVSPLTNSNDDALMSAIEQTHDEFEEDEEVRDLAVRILARFKTRTSIEALSQVALYDLSSNLRSKAIAILTEFDHESVFETVLLACADPTREVRAAAARSLFRLSFDRADAWRRIAETGDKYRMRQAVLAAKEADLVKRSFDRLVHPDRKITYEAVALLSLMIQAGETEEIFKSIENHNDSNVKLALLHVVELTKNGETLSNLYELLEKSSITKELRDRVDQVIQSFEMIPA